MSGFVGIFIGTMGVAVLVNEDGSPQTPADPFTAILESLMDIGGFAKICACIGITASLAAIMSTADSLIIAISQLVTVEIFYPIMPESSPTKMAWFGRLSSVVSVGLALVVGLAWKEGITDLGKIQFPLTMQVVPPFLVGLFATNATTDFHPWCLAAAIASSSIYVIGIYFGYLRQTPAAIDPGITGVAIQAVLAVIFETLNRSVVSRKTTGKPSASALLHPNRPSWDIPKMARFGATTLTPELMWKSMKGFYEPMTNMYWTILMFVSISLITPIVEPSEPPLAEDGTGFLYIPYTIDGLPWWAFKIILLSAIPFVLLLIAIYKIPSDFPMDDEATIAKKGVDVNLVPLTSKEMGRRSSYDEQNVLIHRRRSSISSAMDDIGIQPTTTQAVEEANISPSQKRLSSLVYARDLDKVLMEEIIEEEGGKGKATKDEIVDF